MSDLLKGALIQSANDAADALALSIAPDFPSSRALMNAKAAELGLHDTHFIRPDGLDARRVLERGGQAHGPRLRKAYRHLQTLSRTQLDEGEPLSASPHWREKKPALEMELDAVEMNELMFYSSLKTGDAPGSMASIVKMRGTEVGQKITELAVEAVGWYGTPFTELRNYDSNVVPVGGEYVDDVAPRYFNQRKTTIYGGSSEVQRNVLAKAMLGL